MLDLDPITAPYARESFVRAASGESVRTVARWVGPLPAAARGTGPWSISSVRASLDAPSTVGRIDDRTEPDVLARPRGAGLRW